MNFSMQKKMPSTDIHQCLLNIHGDQSVDVNTARWWVVHFSSDNSYGGSPLLVQIFMSMACWLLFIRGQNAELMVVTTLKSSFVAETFALSNGVTVHFYLLQFPWK